MEEVPLQAELTQHIQVEKQRQEPVGPVAAQGLWPQRPALEEQVARLAEQQEPDCSRRSLGRADYCQMVLDGRVPW